MVSSTDVQTFPSYFFSMSSARLRAVCLCVAVLIVAGCEQSASVGSEPGPMVAGPSTTAEAGAGRTAPIEELPPVLGPRTAPPPDLPPGATAPQARAGEPLPSLAELLNRPPGFGGGEPQIITSTVPMANFDAVRVALLVPLSGPASDLGESMLNAAQMALFQFADERFELLPHDTAGTPEGAFAAAQLAIGDGAKLILGPLLAGSVEAVRPMAQAANVPVVAFSSDKTVAGSGAYVMGFLPSSETERVMTYAISRGLTRFGLLAPDNALGVTVLQTMQETSLANGVEITKARFYDPLGEDFTDVVREISDFENRQRELRRQIAALQGRTDELSKRTLERLEQLQTAGDLPFDALMVADGGRRLQQIAPLLPFFDIDPAVVQVLGTGQMDQRGLGNEPALLGAWFAAPDPTARTEFISEYESIYGKPPHRLATLSYDATALATVLASGPGGPDFSPAALASPNGYWGRDGIFRLVPDGTTERGLAVLEVMRRDKRVIDPAPDTFQPALN